MRTLLLKALGLQIITDAQTLRPDFAEAAGGSG
jgi:hypothetical protein